MATTTRQALSDTLIKVRKRIQQVIDRKASIGEQDTKATLIEPVLSALGWDLQELDEVSREYKRKPQDNPVDYGLFLLRSPRLFVEAKALEKDLNDRRWVSQILGYATVVGVEWCVLTNGDEYRLYNAHAAVDVDEKLFRAVRVSDLSQEEHLLETLELLSKDKMGENLLNVLWKAHFVDRHIKTTLHDIIRNDDPSFVRLLRKKTPELTLSEIRESLKRADIRIDFPVITQSSSPPPCPGKSEQGPTEPLHTPKKSPTQNPVSLKDLLNSGLMSAPFELEVTYKNVLLKALVNADGTIQFGGQNFTSVAVAGGVARVSVSGLPDDGRDYYATNGWTFWKYRDGKTGEERVIDYLRRLYVEQNALPS